MLVTDEKSTVVHPDLSMWANEPPEIVLSPIDSVMPVCYIGALYVFKNTDGAPDFMPFDNLARGLQLALADYPDLCYRLNRIPETGDSRLVTMENVGCRLVTATADFSAADLEAVNFDPIRLPGTLLDGSPADCGDFVAKVKLTRLSDGSAAIGVFLHHNVTDGEGAFSFINRWAAICRNPRATSREPPPPRDRSVLYSDRGASKFDHKEYTYPEPALTEPENAAAPVKLSVGGAPPQFTARLFHMRAEFLRGLKDAVNSSSSSGGSVGCTTNDCLVALLWRCVTLAKGLRDDEATTFGMACNARGRLRLPTGYVGSANFYIARQATAAEVTGSSLADLARMVRSAVERGSSPEYLQSVLRWLDAKPDKSRVLPGFRMFGNDLAFTSWVHFPIYEADFGWGRPLRFAIPSRGFDGLAVLLPRWDSDGYEVLLGSRVEVVDRLAGMPEFAKPF